jgi:protein-tyrosine phosphatase
MTKILMVCLGNICRSPLAEGLLKSKLPKTEFFVDSAGTSGYHAGSPPDLRSIEVANIHGLDISKQKSRRFSGYDFEIFDHIFVMDKSIYNDVVRQANSDEERQKVTLILDYQGAEILEVPDPYYGGDQGFKHVYDLLNKACDFHSNKLLNR